MFGVKLRGKALTALILLCSGVDFLEFGYDQGLLGGILSGDGFRDMLGQPSPTMEGLLSGRVAHACSLNIVDTSDRQPSIHLAARSVR